MKFQNLKLLNFREINEKILFENFIESALNYY